MGDYLVLLNILEVDNISHNFGFLVELNSGSLHLAFCRVTEASDELFLQDGNYSKVDAQNDPIGFVSYNPQNHVFHFVAMDRRASCQKREWVVSIRIRTSMPSFNTQIQRELE